MSDTNYSVEPDRITLHPHWGTGWQTVLNHLKQEIVMRPCLLCLKLPLRRRVPYSRVVRVATVCRETWWSRIWLEHSIGNREERSPMPDKGWMYDILITVEKGNTIRIGKVKSPNVANEIERESRQRLGLSET